MTISNGTSSPIICFGQQPCGFFPKRYLIAKFNTARALQQKIGGRIVFFYHDSDADYRETITIMVDKNKIKGADLSAEALAKAEVRLNFTQENKLQKKHSPLYLKRIAPSLNPSPQGGGKGVEGWKEEILKQLPRFIPPTFPLNSPPLVGGVRKGGLIEIFKSINAETVADFCLEMYKKMKLLEGIEVIRSSDKNFRETAKDLTEEYFADVEFKGEIVRAKVIPHPTPNTQSSEPNTSLFLHEGGGIYTPIAINDKIQKSQITPTAKDRFGWMQNVINCTHYIYGKGEKAYLNFTNFPKVQFIERDEIDNPEFAWLGENLKLKA